MSPKPKLIAKNKLRALSKTRTAIAGLDEITTGGLPSGRSTLICGSAGCGKTLFSLEFIVRGAQEFNEHSQPLSNISAIRFAVGSFPPENGLIIK